MQKEKEKALETIEEAEPVFDEIVDTSIRPIVVSNEIEELELPHIGKEYDAIVKKIRFGTIGQFVEIDKIRDPEVRERLKERENDFAILIEFEIPELMAIGFDYIRYSLHPNSKLMKLARRYGKIKVGDKIKVILNEKGRFKISA